MARAVVGVGELNPERPMAAAEESWVVATDLAEAVARAVWRLRCPQVVGRLVLESVPHGASKPADWTGAHSPHSRPSSTNTWRRCSNPREGMKTREIAGGTGPEKVARALEEAATRLARMRA